MPSTISKPKLKSKELADAGGIWEKARDSASSFLDTFAEKRQGKTRGTTTDAEQDLLRAALIFSGAGLDAVVKQLLTDAGELLVTSAFLATDDGESFIKAVSRRLRSPTVSGIDDDVAGQVNTMLLARLLVSENPRSALCRDLIDSITGGSLQSVDELSRVCALFGLDRDTCIKPQETQLRLALKARNQIIHEMDVDLTVSNRARRPRKRDDTIEHVKALLETAKGFLLVADKRLKPV